MALAEWSVHFHGSHVRAGKVRDQLFTPHESPERGLFRASGAVEEPAERCAACFERLSSRPAIRAGWPRLPEGSPLHPLEETGPGRHPPENRAPGPL
ncbi:hypothetical protein GCM10010345_36050 [Streptomyces canarius]|uniref:Uncharacterized protein n=1 Tax=Streptomyces canarius TaxID=285453 RepID=A0ABQ3CLY5_9ACTN|nr:hypothetical protein GCM10010345_36050 [Streptomyces canarius]